MSTIKEMLARAVAAGASDIHLKPGQRPFLRINGRLTEGDREALSEQNLWEIGTDIMPAHVASRFEAEHEVDFSHHEEGVGRFRVNLFLAGGVPTIAIRYVKNRVPSFEELALPPALKKLALERRGVIIISGPTGSGKSTTMAALVEEMNLTQRHRIITIEDPVEYLIPDQKSVITQREVGLDTLSFHAALKHVVREDPDIIGIGEMRDQITFKTALSAAETGHLVITTLHAGTAAIAVTRLLEFFPSTEREQARLALAGTLHAIVCQRLLRSARGGVVPAVEILINTPTVHKLLEKDRLDVLPAAIETGTEDGMQTFNQAIYGLIRSGTVTEAEGMAHASNPQALKMNLQGIFLDEGKRILAT